MPNIRVQWGSNAYLKRVEYYVMCSDCFAVTRGTDDEDEAERDRQKHVEFHAQD